MRPVEPLALNHSWPLAEQSVHFSLGLVHETSVPAPPALDDAALTAAGIGRWHCDLADDSLTWSPAVYDLFGLPRNAAVSRAEAVALYAEDSRAAMERLRAYAIKHRRGFTLDTRIRPARGNPRWMRLIAMPVCAGSRVVHLHGLKMLVAEEI